MRDPADGYAGDGHQGGKAAADVAEGAEGFQAGDPGGDHIPPPQPGYVQIPASLLGIPPGQHRPPPAVRQMLKSVDSETNRFADPGDQRDVPGGTLGYADGALEIGDDALHAGHFHVQIMFGVA